MKRIKETIGRTIEVTGLAVAMLGAAAMDSADLRYPAAILAAGVILIVIGYRIAPIKAGDRMEDWDEI